MNKLRGVLTDLQKIHHKFNQLKLRIKNIPAKHISSLCHGIAYINTTFAISENNLLDAQNKELMSKLVGATTSVANKGKYSSAYQYNQRNNLMNKLEDHMNGKK